MMFTLTHVKFDQTETWQLSQLQQLWMQLVMDSEGEILWMLGKSAEEFFTVSKMEGPLEF